MKRGPTASMFRRCGALFLVCGFLLAGCAGRLPSTAPVAGNAKTLVLKRFQDFLDRECARSVDADVTLSWQALWSGATVRGMLQIQKPAMLRYTAVDPLGRPLFIIVSDGVTFTAVDTLKGEGYTGPVTSPFWRKYVPEGISPKELFFWLSGGLQPGELRVDDVRLGKNSPWPWIILSAAGGLRHQVLFDPAAGRILRHVVTDRDRTILLDVTYSGAVRPQDDSGCPWPEELEIKGAAIPGTIRIRFDRILSEAVLPAATFRLALPVHYPVHKINLKP